MNNFDFSPMSVSYPNQKCVSHLVKEPCDGEHIYATYNKEALFDVMKFLKPLSPAFALWLILGSNNVNYKNELSQAAMEHSCGLKKSSYYKALEELEKNGFLVPAGKGKQYYTFIEYPKNVKEQFNTSPERIAPDDFL